VRRPKPSGKPMIQKGIATERKRDKCISMRGQDRMNGRGEESKYAYIGAKPARKVKDIWEERVYNVSIGSSLMEKGE